MTQDELNKILADHQLWLEDPTQGNCANLSDANLRGADLSYTNLYKADLTNANLYKANLRHANLYKANLHKADLSFANLTNANLSEAYLTSTDLEFTNIISGTLGAHFYFYHEGYLKIGCKGMSLFEWMLSYEDVGKFQGYSKKQIYLYGTIIHTLFEISGEL
jgi:hypothetical protein